MHHKHTASRKAEVDVTYVTSTGGAHTVRGQRVILASYNMGIPYLYPELPAAQKKG
ncbi:MAG: hypothetical protein U0164_18935 [Gemmatimonadaceae bacterium]